MTYVLTAFLFASIGWFVGVTLTVSKFRDDIAILDAERLELDAERAELLPLAKRKTPAQDRLLAANLLRVHVESVSGKGWRS